MNKIIKRRLISAFICFGIGIVGWIYLAVNHEIGEELRAYLSGFFGGINGVALYFLIYSFRAIRNPKIAKELQNVENDERLHTINNKAFALTFKICIVLEALGSFAFAFCKYMQIAQYLGFVICAQLVLYIVVYYIVVHRN